MTKSPSRPNYESERDRNMEAQALRMICRYWQCNAQKLPISYRLDYAILERDGRLRAFAEIKVRNHERLRYPTFMIAASKVHIARSYARDIGVPAYIFAWFTDGLYWVNVRQDCAFRWGGRNDRNDDADHEPVAHFDVRFMALVRDRREVNEKKIDAARPAAAHSQSRREPLPTL